MHAGGRLLPHAHSRSLSSSSSSSHSPHTPTPRHLGWGCCTQGFEPLDIVLLRRDGRLSGEAFVVVGNLQYVEMTLAKNKCYLGRRYVEVYKAKKMVRGRTATGGTGGRSVGGSTRTACCRVPPLEPWVDWHRDLPAWPHSRGGGSGAAGAGRCARSNACMHGSRALRNPHSPLPTPTMQDYYRAVCQEVMEGGGAPRPYGGRGGDFEGGGGYGGGGFPAAAAGAAGAAAGEGTEGTTILKLRGLPFAVTDDDICTWFNEDTSLGITPVVKDK